MALAIGGWVSAARWGWVEGAWIATASIVVLVIAACFLAGSSTIEVELEVEPRRVTVGEPSAGSLFVRNIGSLRLFPLRAELAVGQATAVFSVPGVGAGQQHEEQFVLPTARRQVIPVGPTTTVRGDPLGLLRRTMTWGEAIKLYVHPKVVRLDNLGAGFLRDLEGQPTADLSNNDVAFHTLREYVPGDDRRFVHWKTTARVGTLMIRQFVDTRRSHLAVLLDTDQEGFASDDEFELAVSIIGSLGVRALSDEQDVTLVTGAGELGSNDGQQLLDSLAGVNPTRDSKSLIELAAHTNRNVGGVSIVALITGSATSIETAREAANCFDPNARVLIVRSASGQPAGLRPTGSATVLQCGHLEEFPMLMWKAARA